MSKHIDGEEEQIQLLLPLLREASKQIARSMRTPLRLEATECLRWLAREAFRLGHQHAYDRSTLLVPDEDENDDA